MGTQQDAQIGLAQESTFKTVTTPTSFFEFTTETFNWVPKFQSAKGQRYGRHMDAADRRVQVQSDVSGDFVQEILTKGHGKLFNAALGAGTSTLVAGSAYQQLFTLAAADYLNSYTIQVGLPLLGGATVPHTYNGMVCSGFQLDATANSIPTLTWSWMGAGVDTSTTLATASYLASTSLMSYVNGSVQVGGSATVPTTTALSSGGTTVGDITAVKMKFDNGLDKNGWYLGGLGVRGRKPALGLRTLSGTITAEFDATTFRDLFLAQTDISLVLTFAGTTAISGSNYPTLQVMIPDIRLDGEIPKTNAGGVITQSINFTTLDNRTAASPVYVAIVTGETAI